MKTRKTHNRPLSILLVLAMVLALLPTTALADGYKEIGVTYNHQGVRADVGEDLSLKVMTDLPSELVSGIPSYQWYKAGSNIYGTGTAIPGATSSSYKVPTDTTGMSFYYCIVTAKIKDVDETTVSSDKSDSPIISVNVQNIGDGFDAYNDGESDIHIVYSSEEDFTFSPGQMNDEGKTVTYKWYKCDAYGFPIEETLNNGRAFLIFGISEDMMMKPIYYKCVATAVGDKSGIEMDEVLFSAVLYPIGVEKLIPFTDVPETAWYYDSVVGAYQMGLIDGRTPTTYCPDDNVTNAEVVKLAVCMNILYHGGDPTDIASGSPWYKPYMDYAVENHIIMYEMSETANHTADRDLFAYILSHALPKEAFAQINTIPDGSIPDVAAPGTELDSFEKSIYMFYRAGILTGTDDKGTFNPNTPIKRSEVAAILIRMMEPSARVGAPSELGK